MSLSYGIILTNKDKALVVKRRFTYGFLDLLMGKYMLNNKEAIYKLIKNTTMFERYMLKEWEYEKIIRYTYNDHQIEIIKRSKFRILKRNYIDIINESFYIPGANLVWEFPKGKMQKNESPYDTAIREFEEETSIRKCNYSLDCNGVKVYILDDSDRYPVIYFRGTCEKVPKINFENIDKTEIDDLMWVDISDFYKLNGGENLSNIYNKVCSKFYF